MSLAAQEGSSYGLAGALGGSGQLEWKRAIMVLITRGNKAYLYYFLCYGNV